MGFYRPPFQGRITRPRNWATANRQTSMIWLVLRPCASLMQVRNGSWLHGGLRRDKKHALFFIMPIGQVLAMRLDEFS